MNEKEVLKRLAKFLDERDWNQFHSVENLAKSFSIEFVELFELFQWSSTACKNLIFDELANKVGVSLAKLNLTRLSASVGKYPVYRAKGKSSKYARL